MRNLRKTINVINNQDENEPKEIEVKDRELNHFWARRARDSSHWSLLLNTGNTLSQLGPLFNPISEEHRTIFTFYMIGSILVYICIFLFYQKKLSSRAVYFVQVYLIVRNTIRVIDLENTKPTIGD